MTILARSILFLQMFVLAIEVELRMFSQVGVRTMIRTISLINKNATGRIYKRREEDQGFTWLISWANLTSIERGLAIRAPCVLIDTGCDTRSVKQEPLKCRIDPPIIDETNQHLIQYRTLFPRDTKAPSQLWVTLIYGPLPAYAIQQQY